MIVIQIIITVIIPAAMIVCGRRLYKNIPEYGSDGFAFKTRMAKLSEDTWTYANRLFASMLFAAGINACIIAVLFMTHDPASSQFFLPCYPSSPLPSSFSGLIRLLIYRISFFISSRISNFAVNSMSSV